MTLFDQFSIQHLMGIPIIIPAILIPMLMIPSTKRLLPSRPYRLFQWVTKSAAKQILTPLNLTGQTWTNTLMSLLLMLIILNTMGLFPYTFTPTTQLSMNIALAFPLWLATVLKGLKTNPNHALAHLVPEGAPGPLIPALIIIETISLFIRPIALAVRLTANLTAGHLLIHLISTATMVLMQIMLPIATLTLTLLFLLTALEIAVAMIQAYVFTLLLSLYLEENT
uniref:ATP synthase subunit a n=1 Tax=Aspidoscelis exsanguis TaxID=2202118 RepID=A0A977TMH8_9SAUR|nr:ATP synthase F0 subunit 6 [Aspidoscelis exsanguis]UXX18055.1 ATP synthase F0 subunit 6 [Aspidoscelis exsanguis]UXX18263.1 ATP synthase F0 subunit 6 [Aspidoscelis exsanguis]UXX18341.1 ATP synthase F0 subunit 6 [Aspidoscelis exsanguis]UXX18354.1 ATP synthase F0 subunit 6 [Aspidoscelis exsanguis]UXX18367.1 ATP synthase F0 subunit 6 [Aspidoscelis exsanguis]